MSDKPKPIGDEVSGLHNFFTTEELASVGECLMRDLSRQRASEQEEIRRQSEMQTALARRRWHELFGQRAVPHVDAEVLSPPALLQQAQPCRTSPQREPRPRLGQRMEQEWKTEEGRRALVELTVRELASHLGIKSHSSFYDVPLFVEKIRPLRDRIQQLRQAENWVERNARARP